MKTMLASLEEITVPSDRLHTTRIMASVSDGLMYSETIPSGETCMRPLS